MGGWGWLDDVDGQIMGVLLISEATFSRTKSWMMDGKNYMYRIK